MLVVDSEVDPILAVLGPGIQAILGPDLIGLYLDGSLALGDFDSASDIDFVVFFDAGRMKIAENVQAVPFLVRVVQNVVKALQERTGDGYVFRTDLRLRPDAGATQIAMSTDTAALYYEGMGDRLKPVTLEAGWVVHRWILREHGITLVGPTPKTLVDPVTADDLRGAMRALQDGWRVWLAGGGDLRQIGFLSYAVLSQCRLLYTLEHGSVVSKAVAAAWALDRLPPTWRPDRRRARDPAGPWPCLCA
ncbi:MAG TPA: DUF4111 domain-containing protein [Anaerolineales bacterium]|nr:DUF4111 domain-containing protein [Anaerolineales bacterium]